MHDNMKNTSVSRTRYRYAARNFFNLVEVQDKVTLYIVISAIKIWATIIHSAVTSFTIFVFNVEIEGNHSK